MNNSPDEYQDYDPIADDMKAFNKRNNRTIWITCGVITAVLLFISLCAAFIVGIIGLAFGAMRSSTPYQEALFAAQTDTAVIEALGEPIEAGWLMSGSIETSGSSGTASFSIPVSGSKGEGTLYVEAQRTGGRWHYDQLYLEVDGQSGLIPLTLQE